MSSCAAYACTSRVSKKIPGITFHRFPKKPDMRAKWILAVRRKDWQPSRHSHLCSKHFTPDQFDRTSQVLVRLKEGAVPCVFEGYPSYFQKKPKAKKTFPRRVSNAGNSISGTAEDLENYSNYASSSITETSNLIDFSILFEKLDSEVIQPSVSQTIPTETKCQPSEKELLKRKLEKALKLKKRYCEKIKYLHQSINNQKQRIRNLNHVLSSLKKERFRRINTSEILSTIIN